MDSWTINIDLLLILLMLYLVHLTFLNYLVGIVSPQSKPYEVLFAFFICSYGSG
jgi:hypothetical protein